MEIRDPVHGAIPIDDAIIPIVTHDFFKRLRGIKQLGLSEFVFPGATHTRFLHSLGVMFIGAKVFEKIFKHHKMCPELIRLRESFKLACLLHDVGHAPLSHATESVMPTKAALNLPAHFLLTPDLKAQATHEDYTVKAIIDSSFSSAFIAMEQGHGIERTKVAELIVGKTLCPAYFTVQGTNYFPLLHQLVSSELDCDRMDYLLRDSYFCGVSYGHFDLDWLTDNLQYCLIDGNAYLGISERAVVSFDDFLLGRFHMFLQVYFHYRSVCLEQLLIKYFQTSGQEYAIPSSIEEYQAHDDHFLMKILRNSANPYAQAIVKNEIPPKIYESFNEKQLKVLEDLEHFCRQNHIDYIRSSSQGRISKYYDQGLADKFQYHLKVVRKLSGKSPTISYLNINESTELFTKFAKAHAVNRFHCRIEQLAVEQADMLQTIISRQ